MPHAEGNNGALCRTWVFTSLAEYQSAFWAKVCVRLRSLGQPVLVFSFDDRSMEIFAAAGIDCVNVPAIGRKLLGARDFQSQFRQLCAELRIAHPNLVLSHERTAFRVRSSQNLERKFSCYMLGAQSATRTLVEQGQSPLFIQELGGFLSTLSTFFVAKQMNLRTLFVEPSFFRGRMFLTPDSLRSPVIVHDATRKPADSVLGYLQNTLASRELVIPKKDAAHYQPAHRKIFNRRNVRRLAEKLRDKYLLGMHQDFGYIGAHVLTHFEMYRNGQLLRSLYSPLPESGTFIYYPLHVPGDVALTLRSPEYLDQLGLVDYLLRTVPHGFRLVIKEHPAQMGALDAGRVGALLKRYDNLCIVSPSINNYEVIGRARLVVSVNSKSGAEAMLMGKPVIVLGDAFYAAAPFVKRVSALRDLPDAMTEALTAQTHDPAAVASYFQCVFDRTYPGELYANDSDNVATFADSLLRAVTLELSNSVASAGAS